MHEAMYWGKLKGKSLQCVLCPRKCVIADGKRGNCRVRENKNGVLYSLVYARPCAVAADPIEKKPMFHFLPGSAAYSFGTAGCNLHCDFCQNWSISQAKPEEIPAMDIAPGEIVKRAIDAGCKSIAYTYTEPGIFYEFALDTARIARKAGLKNVMVTNGFLNAKPTKELYKWIDGVNVDLKGFTEKFYKEVCGAWLKPVLDALILMKKTSWIELTNLVIPSLNDNIKDIKAMCSWIEKNLGADTPLHFSRFFPDYKLRHLNPTPAETLMKAHDAAKKAGLNYVYVGNMPSGTGENTYCPKCGALLIKRFGFEVVENNLKNGKCKCGREIAGVWK